MPLGNLPEQAKKIWESVFDSSKKSGDSEETAARKSWSAVKRGWSQDADGNWVKKSMAEFSMHISKTSYDTKTNTMRWRMTASDTGEDVFGERTSVQLFKNFVERIEDNAEVPFEFKNALREKSGWDGGVPYLSIAHYKSGVEGSNVPGTVEAVFLDGECLKAKGTFSDTELGRAVFKSINEDLAGTSPFENAVRVSIGFLDFSHSHGDFVFKRRSLEDVCPMCEQGHGNKVYLDGQLVHLAFTRIPANERTDVELEEKSMADAIKTKAEDAESIVGKNLAQALEINKSAADVDVLVVKSEEPVAEVVEEKAAPACEDGEDTMTPEDKKKKKMMEEDGAVAKSLADLTALLLEMKSKMDAPVEPSPEIVALRDELEATRSEMAILKSQVETNKTQAEKKPSIPAPRSAVPEVNRTALGGKKLSQIDQLARKSVGLE